MLTHRTNLLLEEMDYMTLSALSRQTGSTVGELIRAAIRKQYKRDDMIKNRKRILRSIERLSKQANTKGIDYRALINDGRKY